MELLITYIARYELDFQGKNTCYLVVIGHIRKRNWKGVRNLKYLFKRHSLIQIGIVLVGRHNIICASILRRPLRPSCASSPGRHPEYSSRGLISIAAVPGRTSPSPRHCHHSFSPLRRISSSQLFLTITGRSKLPVARRFARQAASTLDGSGGPARSFDTELPGVFRIEPLPAPELHRIATNDAANGGSAEKMIQHIETNVPSGSTH